MLEYVKEKWTILHKITSLCVLADICKTQVTPSILIPTPLGKWASYYPNGSKKTHWGQENTGYEEILKKLNFVD